MSPRERGAALVVTLLLLALGLALVAAVTRRATASAQATVRAESRLRSLEAAEAALAEAADRLRQDAWASGFEGECGERATFVVTIEHSASSGTRRRVSATCRGASGEQTRAFVAHFDVEDLPTSLPPFEIRLTAWVSVP